ncbi:hypothetical protein CK203_087280 [Vitis vinifera]|uniref:Uncharacterized protein n=1 Tax=Vitis vinifera TaxID=29760 RepID=A0A438BMA0_VITVI|nr:hypothetical protein CK203_087280 [Vitis vinifera]
MLSSGCDVRKCSVLLPEGVRIGERATCPLGEVRMELLRIAMRATCYQGEGSLQCPPFNLPILPGQNGRASVNNTRAVMATASRTSSPFCQFTLGDSGFVSAVLGFLLPPAPFVGCRFFFGVEPRVGMGMLVPFQPHSKKCLRKRTLLRLARPGRATKMHPKSLWTERPCPLRNLRTTLSTLPRSNSMLGSGSPFYRCSKNFFTSPRSPDLHPSEHSLGADGVHILSMLFNLDLSLLEVLFIYSIKKGKTDLFSLATRLPSLQLVTYLPYSTKGGAKGHVLVRGVWAGLLEHPERPFSPNRSLVLPAKAACTDKRGRVVEWVEKASFDRLNKLFEITAVERHHQTLLTARNLLAVVREPQAYVTNILPRKLPKKVVPGEHFVLKDLPFYKEARKADTQARRAFLNKWEERRQEGTLRRAPGDKRPAPFPPAGALAGKKKKVPTKGIVIRSPAPSGLPSVSSDSVRIPSQNGSGPSMPAAERMTLLVEEATSVYQPDSPHPDADVTGASCPDPLPPTAPPMEETGAERQGLPHCEPSSLAFVPVKGLAEGRSRSARNLKSGIIGRLQDHLLETIEEATSVYQPDSPHPDADVTGASCPDPLPPTTPPMEETGAERQGLPHCEPSSLAFVPVKGLAEGRSRSARNLKSGIIGRLQDHLLETIEEATSVYQPDSPHPDADVTGASCPDPLPPTTPPMEETGAERQGLPHCEPSSLALVPVKGLAEGRSRPTRDLKSGISGRLQDRLLETIEVSCSSAQEDHPGGIPPGSDIALPSTKMFEAAKMLVSGIRGMV